jgi:hypothetical protein
MTQPAGNRHCTCAEVKVGGTRSGSFNLNLDCPLHGVGTEWWNLPEQTAKRQEQSNRLRTLQAKAKAARELGVGCHGRPMEVLEPVGKCPVCDLARSSLSQRQDRDYDTRPFATSLKALGMTLFCGGPGNRRDANRFLSLGDEDKLWTNDRATWLYDHNPPCSGLTVARCWKIAIDECLDPEIVR